MPEKEVVEDKLKIDNSDKANLDYKPTLYEINQYFDSCIVGDDLSRMALFTNWILAERPILMSGSRSSGKTFITDNVSSLIGENSFTLSKGSDKSGWYQAEGFLKCTHVKVIEYNKLPVDMLETLKDWGEGKNSTYDVTVENPVTKRKYVRKYILPFRPFCFCLADENDAIIPVELRSRITEIRTDSSVDQNIKVLTWQANLAMKPTILELGKNNLTDIKAHLSTMPPLEKFEYKHPAADIFLNSIPTLFTDCRREFPKYLYNTYGIARFYWKERIILKRKEKDIILITPQDMWLNHIIFGKALIDSSMKCNAVEKEIVSILKSQTDELTVNMIQRKLRERGLNINSKTVKKHVENLADIGYASKTVPSGQNSLYFASEFFHEFNFDIDWEKVYQKCRETVEKYYPDASSQYETYLQSSIIIHPFTGEKIDILAKKKIGQQTIPEEDIKL